MNHNIHSQIAMPSDPPHHQAPGLGQGDKGAFAAMSNSSSDQISGSSTSNSPQRLDSLLMDVPYLASSGHSIYGVDNAQ